MNEIALKGDEAQPSFDMVAVQEFLDSTGLTKQLFPKEKAMFINMARGYGLNPFKREIYCAVYGQGQYRQCTIVTGYEVYLKRAERTGKLDGWECKERGSVSGGDLAVTVTIYRKDWGHPFSHTAYYSECVQRSGKTGEPNSIWKKQPVFMTRKVAIAQGFRLCFPDEFGGMPYTNDELGVELVNVTPDRQEKMPDDAQVAEPLVQEEASCVPADNSAEEAAVRLEGLLNQYASKLDGHEKEAFECLNKADASTEELEEMCTRILNYLTKKRIRV